MSEIVAVLLLVAIVVGMGVVAYSFASGSLSVLGGGATGLISNQANADAEHFVVEQASFEFSQSLAMDGTSTNEVGGSSTSISSTLSTVNADDVIVAYVSPGDAGSATPPSVSSISGGGLTWDHRVSTSAETYTSSYYVPITLTNGQSSATAATFQQMVTWDPASYTAYEATNLGNVRFCTTSSCATELYSWLESCSSTCSTAGSTSTSATAWVQLTSSIPANSATTIYIVFESTSTNFDGVYWGEAPQLSATYAQYDNGANVFTDYWNFAGTTCPTGWTCSGTTINNGISASGTASYAYTTATFGLTANVLDFYGTLPAATSVNNAGFGYDHDTANGPTVEWTINDNAGAAGCASTNACFQTATTGAAYHYTTTTTPTGTLVYSIYWGSTASATAYYSYANAETSTTDIPTAALSLGIYHAQGAQATIGPFDWLRLRVYPPNGAMPTVALGSTGSIADTFDLEEWYAVAPTALSSVTVTATLSSSDTAETWIALFGINGASTASPFDSNSSLPATSVGASPSTTMSTSDPDDVLLYACAAGSGSTAAGFTGLYSTAYSPDQGEYVGYESVSATQSNLATSCGANSYGAEITDAVPAFTGGANLYVRNVGTISSTLVSVFVVDQSTKTFVAQYPTSMAVGPGGLAEIPYTSLSFSPARGNTYSFKVTSSLGNSAALNAEAT